MQLRAVPVPEDARLIDRAAAWFHAQGVHRSSESPLRRFAAGVSWAIWMTILCERHPMTRGNRVRAVLRLWLWQVWRRTVKRPIMVHLPADVSLLCPAWSRLAGTLVSVGFHEPDDVLFVVDTLRRDDWLLDVGANLGIYAIAAARRGARVIAFEPFGAARATLEANARLNQVAGRIEVESLALAHFNGRAPFTAGLDVGNHLLDDALAEESSPFVDVSTLDAYLEARPEPFDSGPMVILKIDVEGFEAQVLDGARGFIERVQPVMAVEVWGEGRPIRDRLEPRGYRLYRYASARRALVEIPDDFAGEGNLIAVPASRLRDLEARLAHASRPPLAPPAVDWLGGRGIRA
jgi:FkbM family methyltransferase